MKLRTSALKSRLGSTFFNPLLLYHRSINVGDLTGAVDEGDGVVDDQVEDDDDCPHDDSGNGPITNSG